MVDVYGPPIGTYTHVQVIAANSQAEVIANLNALAALLGLTLDSTKLPGNPAGCTELGNALHPDFNKIPAGTRHKIGMELAAIAYHVDNAPTS